MNEHDNDVPMIPKHQAEMHDMNLVTQNGHTRTLAIVVVIVLAIVTIATALANVEMSKNYVSLTKTFVDNYTSRTEKWLETLLRMQNWNGSVTEGLNEKEQTGYVQQFQIP